MENTMESRYAHKGPTGLFADIVQVFALKDCSSYNGCP